MVDIGLVGALFLLFNYHYFCIQVFYWRFMTKRVKKLALLINYYNYRALKVLTLMQLLK